MSFQPQNNEQALLYKILTGGLYITDMSYLFYSNARMDNYETILGLCKDVTKASYCFYSSDIETFDSANFPDMSKCDSFGSMFASCPYLVSADLSHLDCSSLAMSNGSGFYDMFRGCWLLEEVIGFAYNASEYPNTGRTFYDCPCLKRLTFAENVGALTTMDLDISGCSFEREGMVELFNSLPTVEQKCTLTIANNPCITGTLIVTVPRGEYDGYIEDADTLITVLNENVFDDTANCIINDASDETTSYTKENLIAQADNLLYPVELEWRDHSYEVAVDKLTDDDRLIAKDKGWSLIEK